MGLKSQLASHQARMQEISDEIEAVGAAAETEGRDMTAEDSALIDSLSAEFDTTAQAAERCDKAIAAAEKVKAARHMPAILEAAGAQAAASSITGVPARVKGQRSRVFDSSKAAFDSGMAIYAMIGHPKATQYCQTNGIDIRNDHSTGTPSLGGYTVPVEMANTIIRLVEEYGVMRRNARNYPMGSNVTDVPTRVDGLTVNYIGEGSEISKSDMEFGTIQLVAKKPAIMTLLSTELEEDSIINIVDLLTTEMAWGFAQNEDSQCFVGGGSPITGIKNAVDAASNTDIANAAALTLADLHGMLGKLPRYPGIQPKWYMSSEFFHSIVGPLLDTLGGTNQRHFEEGQQQQCLGYPVEFTNVLNAGGAGTMVAVFGDLGLGTVLGTRRQVTIKRFDELYGANDQIGLQGTMRHDFAVTDPGSTGKPGCVLTLTTTA